MKSLDHYWYSHNIVSILLTPVSVVFWLLLFLRKYLYKFGIKASYKSSLPVIVVGNISVGGTGKSPLVVFLVRLLQRMGYRPGVVSRGYGGKSATWPQTVDKNSDPDLVGDESVMIAVQSEVPVVVAPRRSDAVRVLEESNEVDVIVSDDGLQHYAMARSMEIAVIDGVRQFGNKLLIPAGPLREPVSRLKTVDFVVSNGGKFETGFNMFVGNPVITELSSGKIVPITQFENIPVHAVAGIGNPNRFFDLLSAQGIKVIKHAFSDHYEFNSEDINFNDELAIFMTAKDAVKCQKFNVEKTYMVSVESEMDEDFINHFEKAFEALVNG